MKQNTKSLVDKFRNFMTLDQQLLALSDMVFIMNEKAWNSCNGKISRTMSHQVFKAMSVPEDQDYLNILGNELVRTINCELLGHE